MNLPGEIEDLGGLPEQLLAVVVIFLVGGLTPGVLAAVGSFLLANFFLTPPYHTLAVEGRDSIIALLVFLLVAVTVSLLVDVAARRQAIAARSEADAESLARVAAEPLADGSAEDVLAQVATTFALTSIILVEHDSHDDGNGPRTVTGTTRRLVGPARAAL